MLRAAGFDTAAVLDGGLAAWVAEGRPTEAGARRYPAARLSLADRPGAWADRADVLAAIRAQQQVGALQGQRHTYFCGAWTGYGFHEDGLKSGLSVASQLEPLIDQAPGALA